MHIPLSNRPVGKCSRCNGVVSVPSVWMGVQRPPQRCESCGAVADPTEHLPTIKMLPPKGQRIKS